MKPPIPQIIPQMRHENPHLISRPPQRPRKQRQAHRLAAPEEVLECERADLLMVLVLGPRVDGPLELLGVHFGEAGGLHHLGHVGDDIEGEVDLGGRFVHVVVPFDEGRVGGQGVVVAFYDEIDVVDFEVAVVFEESGFLGLV